MSEPKRFRAAVHELLAVLNNEYASFGDISNAIEDVNESLIEQDADDSVEWTGPLGWSGQALRTATDLDVAWWDDVCESHVMLAHEQQPSAAPSHLAQVAAVADALPVDPEYEARLDAMLAERRQELAENKRRFEVAVKNAERLLSLHDSERKL